jgi:hypothetical protein
MLSSFYYDDGNGGIIGFSVDVCRGCVVSASGSRVGSIGIDFSRG